MIDNRSLLHILIVLVVSCGVGLLMYISNPDGLWLYTPPADGSGIPSNAFGVGASLGAIISVLFYTVILVFQVVWRLIKKPTQQKPVTQFISAIVVGVLLLIFVGLYFR